MDIKTHCPECKAEFLTELEEPVLTELGLQLRSPEVEAKVAEDSARLEEEIANLRDEVTRLESQDHDNEVVAAWMNDDSEEAIVAKANFVKERCFTDVSEEAEVAEENEPETVADKPEVVYQDPHDDDYQKVPGIPVYILSKKA